MAEPMRGVDVDALLDRLPSLAARPRTVEALSGGLTNLNLKVTTPERTAVVRISTKDSELLSIDRHHEHANSQAAAAAGVAPAVLDYLPGEDVLAVAFIDGRTLSAADLHDHATLGRVADACRRLHAGPRFANDFDMFVIQLTYLRIVTARGFRMPADYLEHLPAVERIRSALAVRDDGTVPCNNDLLAANMIDDGERLWLIDYEYAGNNDACFELGNIWSEAALPLEHLEHLVDAYYGRHLRHKVARARLLGLMSKYGWTLWASIQDGMSTLDFDFWAWGLEKYHRALPELAEPVLSHLLAESVRED